MPGPYPDRVVGCGHPDVGDDALGLLAVRIARPALGPGVDVIEIATADRLVDLLAAAGDAIVVDAVRTSSGAVPPGTLLREVASREEAFAIPTTSMSSHGLGIADAVALAAALGPLPRVVFLGLEAERIAVGSGLSPAVESALPALVAAIVAEARNLGPAA
jgi:hydrogenase maturation protease